jgi:polyisoprenoid-binding protein YceI
MLLKKILLASILSLSIAIASFATEKFEIDSGNSSIHFSVNHLVISNAKGSFKDFSGVILYDETNTENSSVNVVIKTASIDTDNEARDKHLRDADFFDVQKYPEITFKSTKVQKKGKSYVCVGTLTMHGVSKEVTIPFEINGVIKDPLGGISRLGAHGDTSLNRKDYGLNWNKVLDNGGLAVGENVKISLEVEAVKK